MQYLSGLPLSTSGPNSCSTHWRAASNSGHEVANSFSVLSTRSPWVLRTQTAINLQCVSMPTP